MYDIPQEVAALLSSGNLTGKACGRITFLDKVAGTQTIPITSFYINRQEVKFSDTCTIEFPNVNPNNPLDLGYYSPDRGIDYPDKRNEWYQEMLPGKEIRVELGYVGYYAPVFTGFIDTVLMDPRPRSNKMQLQLRDYGRKLLDQQICEGATNEYLSYSNMDATDIASDLCLKAGIPQDKLQMRKSGIVVDFIEFENTTFADALSKLMDATSFELTFDELGNLIWNFPTDRQPRIDDLHMTLNGETIIQLPKYPISKDSEKVKIDDMFYSSETDYEINWGKGTIKRRLGSTIPDNSTVNMGYVYAAYVFKEGVNIFSLPYTITGLKQWGTIIVNGASSQATWKLPNPEARGAYADKILVVDAPSINTIEKTQECANRLGADMMNRFRMINFQAIGIPWIQMYDSIQVIESSTTASEIYRIVGLILEFSEGKITMTIQCYHSGFTDF